VQRAVRDRNPSNGHKRTYNETVTPSSSERSRPVCPNCGETLRFRNRRESVCMACNEPAQLAWSYRRYTAYLALLAVVLIAFATYRPTSGGLWIMGLVLFWPLITVVLWAILPPSYERGYPQPKFTLVAACVTVFATVFAVEFVGFAVAYIVLGAKPSEIKEQLYRLSMPLALFNSQFLITPEKRFVDACGVMVGNSLLIALPIFGCVKVVQAAFRRNRVTQIGITDSVDESDD
jgi:hypothetical protein